MTPRLSAPVAGHRAHRDAVLALLLTHVGPTLIVADLHAETFARTLAAAASGGEGRLTTRADMLRIAFQALEESRPRGQAMSTARRRLEMFPLVLDPTSAAWIHALEPVARRHVDEALRGVGGLERRGLLNDAGVPTALAASGMVYAAVGGDLGPTCKPTIGTVFRLRFFTHLERELDRVARNGGS